MQKQTKRKIRGIVSKQSAIIQELEGRVLMSASAVKFPTAKLQALKVQAPKMHTTFDTIRAHGLAPAASSSPPSFAITPAKMRAYYGIDTIQFGNISGDGRGMTIAIVDAYDQPNLQSDFNAFNSFYNLPTSTITKYSQTGSTTLSAAADVRGGWGIETTLDVEWAHVIAPLANIVVVEGNSNGGNDLFTAAQTAAGLPNVAVVSMSFGSGEFSTETSWDNNFTTPAAHSNVTFVASTGDVGSPGSYPAYSPNVIAVGGTIFTFDNSNNINGEAAWTGSGGGTSTQETMPSYQAGFQTTGMRTTPDVAMDASPSTGVAIFDSYDFNGVDGNNVPQPWAVFGGTSLAAPMFGGVVAIADQGRVQNSLTRLDGRSQALPLLYGLSTGDFHDITSGPNNTSGSNGSFVPTVGYDQVTGRGSPVGSVMPNHLANITPSLPTINDSIAGDTITFTEDPSHLYIDWTAGSSSGQFTNTNPAGLKLTGLGNTTLQFNYTNGSPVPAILSLNGTFTLNGLQGTNPLAGAKWNINTSTLFFMYTPGSDPITAVTNYLKTGYNSGAWNGAASSGLGSIVSSNAAADASHLHGIGYVDSADGTGFNTTANSIKVRYTLFGDTALIGSVGFADFMRMTQHYTTATGGSWDGGDFNYDGAVNAADFNLLQPTYGLSLATTPAPVPAATPDATPATDLTATPSTSPAADPSAGVVTPVVAPATPTAHRKNNGKRSPLLKRIG